MPYQILRHADRLLWVTMRGQLSLDQAEAYYHELWGLLDASPRPTDMLVDGRGIAGASASARQRTEQVAHHPHLGHIAFVVSDHHLLLFAPLVKLVSGIGLFGHEEPALAYLRAARGLPPLAELHLPIPESAAAPPSAPAEPPAARRPPPAPAPRSAPQHGAPRYRHQRPAGSGGLLHSLTDMMHSWSDSLGRVGRDAERD